MKLKHLIAVGIMASSITAHAFAKAKHNDDTDCLKLAEYDTTCTDFENEIHDGLFSGVLTQHTAILFNSFINSQIGCQNIHYYFKIACRNNNVSDGVYRTIGILQDKNRAVADAVNLTLKKDKVKK